MSAPARRSRPRRRRPSPMGFTILELLVVISIIAVLVAILVPAINKAYDAGIQAVCLSNARQIMIATHAYATDHRRVLPGLPGGYPTYWVPSLVGPYMNGNAGVWACPDSESSYDTWDGQPGDWSASYGYNTFGLRFARISSIRKPSDTAAWIESRSGATVHGHSLIMPTAGIPGYSMGLPRYRHDNRLATVAMLDGHVKTLDIDSLERTDSVEDGQALAPNTIDPYVLWNRH